MAKSLCELQLQLTRSKGQNIHESNMQNDEVGNFPNSKELVEIGETNLKEHCRLGMRAKYIIQLAKNVESGTLSLEKLEKNCNLYSYQDVHRRLSKLKGFGPFSIATVLMCMGCYQKVPADSETKRHIKQVYGISSCKSLTIVEDAEQIYMKYAPFQSIVFWFELLQSYEKKYGKLSELDESNYHTITGSRIL
ncbi:unnamed protein product [Sphenostylis stenocarpa]|uniref:HhH-GPD domain-containing protein n=1 Tax=Sphenostylis stenocarpa TaxID=92480 RepID=A0AA86SQ61_9FABA|nr:unnamed protein product [Sphenostylis stenocarpa]